MVDKKALNGMVDKKALTTSFSPVTSINVGISPQNILTFSFKHLWRTGVNSQYNTYSHSQIIEVEPRPPLQKSVFSDQILIILRL